jgi:predicted peroxiredoxin
LSEQNLSVWYQKDIKSTVFFQILIVITDGFQTKRQAYTPLHIASQPIKDKGVEVWAIGIGSALNEKELKQIASKPSNVLKVTSFENLSKLYFKLVPSVCKGKYISALLILLCLKK